MSKAWIATTAIAIVSGPAWAECTAIGQHDPAVLKYICDSERSWAESVATGDPATVKRILAEDFIGVHPSGRQYRKAEMVEGTPTAPKIFASNHMNDVVVRFYGNVAIAQGSETWRKKNGDTGRFVWTDTWLKQKSGEWQIESAEDLIAPAEPAK
jgi:ketosteroid isomerase-like protein